MHEERTANGDTVNQKNILGLVRDKGYILGISVLIGE